MSHGCGEYSVDDRFEGKPARVREVYDALVALVGELDPSSRCRRRQEWPSWCGCGSRP
jgi:hypothetical protein